MTDVRKIVLAVAAASLFGAPLAASAQPVPSYASQDEEIHGTVASVNERTVYVRDDRGFVDTVHLHDGTVINPTGLTLAAGQSVTIHGRSDGRAFDANEIDTPYQEDGGYSDAPDAAYVAPYAYYPYYPAYALSYPAFISLGFGFGWGGYYGGGYGGYYGRGGYYGHGGYGYGRGGYYGHGGYGYGGYANGGARYPLGNAYGRGGSYGARSYGGSSRGYASGAVRSGGGGGGFHGGGGGHR